MVLVNNMGNNTGVAFTRGELTIVLGVILLVLLFCGFIQLYLNVYKPFIRERNYIKMEMGRSKSKNEYEYWKKELKYLYIKKIPVLRMIYRKRKR